MTDVGPRDEDVHATAVSTSSPSTARQTSIHAVLIRTGAVAISVVLTAGYLYSLLLFTFGACYMREVTCAQGWIARTIGTVIYLGLVAATVLATCRLLRSVNQRVAARQDGVL